MNHDTKELIQKMKYDGELTHIKEDPLRTYYTCVRYNNIAIGTHADYPYGAILYGPGQWSCMKGWFETHDDTFKENRIDLKVLNYCKFRNTEEALKKDIGSDITLFMPKDKDKN